VSTLAVEQPRLEGLEAERTLDDVLVGAWTQLCSHRAVECPLCHGEMEPEYGARALEPDDSGAAHTGEAGCRAGGKPEGGRCTSCGAVLR
jgi:hypothetical protein